jgi:hypothetical protein
MKKLIAILAGLALASAAWAKVDPTRPMVTGRGNVATSPQKVIVTNQTAPDASSDGVLKLDKFEVTGSLLPHATAKATPAPTRK